MDERVTSANTAFGFGLFARLVEIDSQENIFVSPLSVAIALAMTYNGASGATQLAMAESLKLSGLDLQDVNSGNSALLASLESIDPSVELAIANSVWARQGVEFKEDFLERNRQFFEAEISTLDFNDPASVGAINGWVRENTNGKIESILDRIDPLEVLFLINAIYFNGQWTVEFDENRTRNLAFHVQDGTEIQHPMMSQLGKYQYLDGEGFQAVSLPYGGNERVSMYMFLPDAESSLRDFLADLDAENWESWLSKFNTTEGSIVIPRFKVEYDSTLNNALTALGMGLAFDMTDADFSAMTDVQVYISKVKHKAVLEVNEEGTEAAAVTSIEVGVTTVVQRPERFSFVADRPFFFAIRDSQTGSVLFMGNLVDPSE